jgi:hypothetical protein
MIYLEKVPMKIIPLNEHYKIALRQGFYDDSQEDLDVNEARSLHMREKLTHRIEVGGRHFLCQTRVADLVTGYAYTSDKIDAHIVTPHELGLTQCYINEAFFSVAKEKGFLTLPFWAGIAAATSLSKDGSNMYVSIEGEYRAIWRVRMFLNETILEYVDGCPVDCCIIHHNTLILMQKI